METFLGSEQQKHLNERNKSIDSEVVVKEISKA